MAAAFATPTPPPAAPAAPPPAPIGQELYAGTAMYGRFMSTVGAVVGVIIGLIILIIGYTKLRDPHTAVAAMTVMAVSGCAPRAAAQPDQPPSYSCAATVSFVAQDGQLYSGIPVTVVAGAPLAAGSTIALRYDPGNPKDVVQELPPRLLGWGLIGGGVLLGSLSVGVAALAFKSKGFASLQGTMGLLNFLRR